METVENIKMENIEKEINVSNVKNQKIVKFMTVRTLVILVVTKKL